MNTEQTAQQLRLAAEILETGHPWEYCTDRFHWKLSTGKCPMFAISSQWEIRLALATPPDGRPLHNPDNLTAEQVGVGWRLLTEDEPAPDRCDWYGSQGWETSFGRVRVPTLATYRVPLSTPWPEPDPYAALKQAHKEGKVIEARLKSNPHVYGWVNCAYPRWSDHAEYRIKPSTPPFQLPPEPPGVQWHRKDWTAEMLPQGHRPLVEGEVIEKDDETPGTTAGIWQKACASLGKSVNSSNYWFWRTRRPLTFTHEGKTWTWHRPGDPMPCDKASMIHYLDTKGSCYGSEKAGQLFEVFGKDYPWLIIGWRYADEPKPQVPLGPEDVPPGSVFAFTKSVWIAPLCVSHDGVGFPETEAGKPLVQKFSYEMLMEVAKINRSLPLTGLWNPDAWEPCHKPSQPSSVIPNSPPV